MDLRRLYREDCEKGGLIMQIYHQYINRGDVVPFNNVSVSVSDSISSIRDFVTESIAFQNKCNRRKAKVSNSCKNTFHAKRWK